MTIVAEQHSECRRIAELRENVATGE